MSVHSRKRKTNTRWLERRVPVGGRPYRMKSVSHNEKAKTAMSHLTHRAVQSLPKSATKMVLSRKSEIRTYGESIKSCKVMTSHSSGQVIAVIF